MTANGVIEHLVPEPAGPPNLVEQWAEHAQVGLAYMRRYVSATLQPTVEIVSLVGSYGLSQASIIKDYGLERANDVLDTRLGTVFLSGFNLTAQGMEKLIDYLLPVDNGDSPRGGARPMEVIPEGKARAVLHRIVWLTVKLRTQLRQVMDANAKDARHLAAEHVAILFSVIDRIVSTLRTDVEDLVNHVNLMWRELSSDELRAQAFVKETALNISAFCAEVPSRLASLVPVHLSEKLQKSAESAATTYDSIVNVRRNLETVQNEMLGMAISVEASLNDFNAIAMQLMHDLEALEMKKMEIKEKKRQN